MKELSKEEMLKRLQELEEENKKLKEEKRMAENLKGIITKDDIFSVFKRLISQSTQTFSLL
jgi:cell shape-determining protein MreC